MANPILRNGLFINPIALPTPIIPNGLLDISPPLQSKLEGFESTDFGNDCGYGYNYDIYTGFCVPDTSIIYRGGGTDDGLIGPPPISTSTTTILNPTPITILVNNSTAVTDEGIAQVAAAVNQGITQAAGNADKIVQATTEKIQSSIAEETDAITGAIGNASTNLGNEVTITTAALAASTAATVGTIGGSISSLVNDVKTSITPILTSISGFIHDVNVEVQQINDTLLSPIISLYNSTIGTISNLTNAIEQDLHEGLGGLLKVPGQLADQLGSFDASLQRTVEQLGTLNKETITSSIDYLGDKFPAPFSAAMNTALSGKSVANSLSTTFNDQVALSSESLSQVSVQAISGLGKLLRDMLRITSDSFKESLDGIHKNWLDVGSVFTPLLDGALSLLTTLTAIAALAGPLIEAAEEEAHKLIPITKLDPATIIEALKSGFLQTQTALDELRTHGFDATRSQVLIDMSVFLADTNIALEWWYRGIIADDDLIANLIAHGFKTEDITAYKEGSINLPSLGDIIRWMNFGIITVEQFTVNARILRYDDAQITAILATYQERETPQTLSQLDGLLNNSNAGFLNATFNQEVPSAISIAGTRAGMHPDLIRYIWLSHWQIPQVETFIQAHFRGLRTQTELEQRMSIANIPRELWDDIIKTSQSLIPYRSIPSFVANGFMSPQRAQQELASHGFDLEHQEILMKSFKPPVDTTNSTAVQQIVTLSIANAKLLWEDGSITDDQYSQILQAHKYTPATAALQIKVDSVSRHIKAQKSELTDLASQVESGVMSSDDAVTKLQQDGFTTSQISKFVLSIAKFTKLNAKIPSIPELTKFLKAQLIDITQYTQALTDLGWQEPWLTAYLGLVSDTSASGTTATQA